MPNPKIDPRILALCDQVTAKRPKTVVQHILSHGSITTEELQSIYNYDHPPRAIRDVRENGIPLVTFKVKSDRTNRMIAAYKFGDPDEIKHGRIGGRKALPKKLKEDLIREYGESDHLTGVRLDPSYLQIDHRVPYEVSGDDHIGEYDINNFMLLDAYSQRAKSWACESCQNWKVIRDPETCKSCYWAFPEDYSHVAMREIRRVDLQWIEGDVQHFDKLRTLAKKQNLTVAELSVSILNKYLSKI